MFKKLAIIGLFLSACVYSNPAFTQIIDWPQAKFNNILIDKTPINKPAFIAPNEENPAQLKPILAHLPKGLLITVGSERGFITASLSDKIDSILFIDKSEGITFFNQVNTALLQISNNRQDYLNLRLLSSHQAWLRSALNDGHDILKDPQTFLWWERFVKNNGDFASFQNSDGGIKRAEYKETQGHEPFEDANYLEDDILFERVQKLAKQNKIQAITLDLESYEVGNLTQKLNKNKVQISALDISNAWAAIYISNSKLVMLLAKMKAISNPKTLLITTTLVNSTTDREILWRYEAFTLEKIFSHKLFIDRIYYKRPVLRNKDAVTGMTSALDGMPVPREVSELSKCRKLLGFFERGVTTQN